MLGQAVLLCTTILFGIIAQMILLNVNMKTLRTRAPDICYRQHAGSGREYLSYGDYSGGPAS